MRNHALIVLIAVAITLCLVTLSNANVDKSNLVKREATSPYSDHGGLYSSKDKKHKKKKHKNKNYRRRLEKRDGDDPDPDLGEVNIREEDKAALLKKRANPPVSTGSVDATKILPGNTHGNP